MVEMTINKFIPRPKFEKNMHLEFKSSLFI